MKVRKPPHLSQSDERRIKEILRVELRPLAEEVRKLRKELDKKCLDKI